MARYPNYFEKKKQKQKRVFCLQIFSQTVILMVPRNVLESDIFFSSEQSLALEESVQQTRFLLTGRIKSLNSTCITILLLSYNLPLHIFTIYLLHESCRKYIQFFQQTLTSWFSHNLISGLFYTYQNKTMRLILSIPNY